MSNPLANPEVERYTFWAPGQATAYFYWLHPPESELRGEVEKAMGSRFRPKAYHDFILAGAASASPAEEGGSRELCGSDRCFLAEASPAAPSPRARATRIARITPQITLTYSAKLDAILVRPIIVSFLVAFIINAAATASRCPLARAARDDGRHCAVFGNCGPSLASRAQADKPGSSPISPAPWCRTGPRPRDLSRGDLPSVG